MAELRQEGKGSTWNNSSSISPVAQVNTVNRQYSHLSSIVNRLSSIVNRQSFIVNRLSSIVNRQPLEGAIPQHLSVHLDFRLACAVLRLFPFWDVPA